MDATIRQSSRLSTLNALRYTGAALTLVVGVVHIQQYLDLIGDVPTIAELFVLNGIGAGIVVVLLMTRLRLLGALGGIGLSIGALVSLAIARYVEEGLFDYIEPTFRAPVIVAVLAEVGAVVALSAYLVRHRAAETS